MAYFLSVMQVLCLLFLLAVFSVQALQQPTTTTGATTSSSDSQEEGSKKSYSNDKNRSSHKYFDPCGVNLAYTKKCGTADSEELNEYCLKCVLNNCSTIYLIPDVTCQEIQSCIINASCQ